MKRLWDFVDGEPFLVNPHLGIINPGKGKRMAKRKGKMPAGLRRYWAAKRGRKAAPKRVARRRKARRNPWPLAGAVVANPRRRTARRRRAVMVRARRRRGYRRNPGIMRSLQFPAMNQVLFAGVGFIAPPMVEGFLSQFVPASLQGNAIGKYAVRVAAVLAVAFGVRKFIGQKEGNMAAIGGGVYVLSTAAVEFLPNFFAASLPAAPSVQGYVNPTRALGAYVSGSGRTFNTLGGNNGRSMAMFADDGNSGGTASRFKRI